MTKRPPYFLSVRTPVQLPAIMGSDTQKGVEVRIATEQGAIVLRVRRLEDGSEWFTVNRGTHVDYRGEVQGTNAPVVAGPVAGPGTVFSTPWHHNDILTALKEKP
jgi:hypothetical protein